MSGHEGHGAGCYVSVSVRFAKPDEIAAPIALAAGAIASVIGECAKVGAAPNGLINVAIGPCDALLPLFEAVSQGVPANVATIGNLDQVGAILHAEPDRFAALAFAHLLPDGQS